MYRSRQCARHRIGYKQRSDAIDYTVCRLLYDARLQPIVVKTVKVSASRVLFNVVRQSSVDKHWIESPPPPPKVVGRQLKAPQTAVGVYSSFYVSHDDVRRSR